MRSLRWRNHIRWALRRAELLQALIPFFSGAGLRRFVVPEVYVCARASECAYLFNVVATVPFPPAPLPLPERSA